METESGGKNHHRETAFSLLATKPSINIGVLHVMDIQMGLCQNCVLNHLDSLNLYRSYMKITVKYRLRAGSE